MTLFHPYHNNHNENKKKKNPDEKIDKNYTIDKIDNIQRNDSENSVEYWTKKQ